MSVASSTCTLPDAPREPIMDVEKADVLASDASLGFTTNRTPGDAADQAQEKTLERSEPESLSEFEVVFTGDDDPRSPRNIPELRRWIIVLIMASTSMSVACVSSLYAETYAQISREFDISQEVATLGLSLFVFGLGLSPMALGPLSEFYGRKPVYIISLAIFAIWIIPCAVAQNIQTLLVMRFFDGLAGATFLSVAGGTVGDLFAKEDLAAPMTVFALSPFCGPILGPLIGGFINYYISWRWTFWVALIWCSVQFLLVLFFVPETYHPVVLRNEARRLRKESGNDKYFARIEVLDRSVAQTVIRSCYRPFLLLTLEPMCLVLCTYCALLLGILYLFFGAFNLVFTNNHGFNLWQTGLTFLGILVGMIASTIFNPFIARNYKRLLKRHELQTGSPGSEPEYRLPSVIIGAPFVTVGLLWFGWTTYPTIHWIVPIIGSGFFGVGIILIFTGVWTFLVDAYPLYAASALAANGFLRSVFAGAFPLFGDFMYERLGYQWATFVLAMVSLVMLPFPIIFYKYGKQLRARSKYAGAR